jgi:hypothetical protein
MFSFSLARLPLFDSPINSSHTLSLSLSLSLPQLGFSLLADETLVIIRLNHSIIWLLSGHSPMLTLAKRVEPPDNDHRPSVIGHRPSATRFHFFSPSLSLYLCACLSLVSSSPTLPSLSRCLCSSNLVSRVTGSKCVSDPVTLSFSPSGRPISFYNTRPSYPPFYFVRSSKTTPPRLSPSLSLLSPLSYHISYSTHSQYTLPLPLQKPSHPRNPKLETHQPQNTCPPKRTKEMGNNVTCVSIGKASLPSHDRQ